MEVNARKGMFGNDVLFGNAILSCLPHPLSFSRSSISTFTLCEFSFYLPFILFADFALTLVGRQYSVQPRSAESSANSFHGHRQCMFACRGRVLRWISYFWYQRWVIYLYWMMPLNEFRRTPASIPFPFDVSLPIPPRHFRVFPIPAFTLTTSPRISVIPATAV